MKHIRRATVACVASLSFAGCTEMVAVKQLPACGKQQNCTATAGEVYSLPKGQFLLQVSRRPFVSSDLTAQITALTNANEVVKKDLAAISQARQKVSDDKAKKADPMADQATLDGLVTTLSVDTALRDLAQKDFDQRNGDGKGVETFALTQQTVAPDPSARYSVEMNHSALRDDNLRLSFANGLLTSATATSKDESLNSLVTLAEAGISLAVFAASGIPLIPAPPPKGAAAAAPPVPSPFPIECTYDLAMVFDPLNKKEVGDVNDALAAHGSAIVVTTDATATTEVSTQATERGLAYRVPTSVVVNVGAREQDPNGAAGAGMNWQTGPHLPGGISCPLQSKPGAQSVLALVPDSRTHSILSAEAGAFTTTSRSFTFTAGMLTDSTVDRPSEVVAPFAAVGKLAQDIVAIPASIVKMRLDYTNSSADLVEAQTKLFKDQSASTVATVNSVAALADARAALVKAEFGDKQAFVDAEANLLKAQQTLQDLVNKGKTSLPASANSAVGSPASTTQPQ